MMAIQKADHHFPLQGFTMKSVIMAACFLTASWCRAFQVRPTPQSRRSAAPLQGTASNSDQVEAYLQERYPIFMNMIMSKSDGVWKKLRQSEGYTIFAPTDQAFQELGDKRYQQLQDDRNFETVEKIAAYHAINEPVSAEDLFAAGGVITLGGNVPVEPATTGGFFGIIGGKQDGGVTVNGAKVLNTEQIAECTLHEVDKLISPQILWRYMDQLRIPGT